MYRLMVIDFDGSEESRQPRDRYYGTLAECLERTDSRIFLCAQNYDSFAIYERTATDWALFYHSI